MQFIQKGKEVIQIEPHVRSVAMFSNSANEDGLCGDYVEFLNNKYCDKNINEEWPKPNNKKRIEYHSEQLMLLLSGREVKWSEDGDKVKEV